MACTRSAKRARGSYGARGRAAGCVCVCVCVCVCGWVGGWVGARDAAARAPRSTLLLRCLRKMSDLSAAQELLGTIARTVREEEAATGVSAMDEPPSAALLRTVGSHLETLASSEAAAAAAAGATAVIGDIDGGGIIGGGGGDGGGLLARAAAAALSTPSASPPRALLSRVLAAATLPAPAEVSANASSIVPEAPSAAAAAAAASSSSSATAASSFYNRDEAARIEEISGAVVFRVISNDGARAHLIWLTQVKNIFATQLPKMPREYISRLVFDRRHRTLLALKNDRVVGGVCYRPFLTQHFAEIAFCAVTSSEQVKGYGTRLMNHLKEAVKLDGISHFLTYADNYAIGYFKKQGFTKAVSMPPEQWVGYIKDYDGGTLMECTIHSAVNYLDVPGMVSAQREWVLARIRAAGHSHVVYPGLAFPPPPGEPAGAAAAAALAGAGEAVAGAAAAADADGYLADLNGIPGVLAAGWDAGTLSSLQVQRDRNLLQQRLAELTELLVKHDDSWPFREPVDLSLVPEYATLIKEPIGEAVDGPHDSSAAYPPPPLHRARASHPAALSAPPDLSLIKRRVEEGAYNSLEHYLADVNLMFRNCRAFNRLDTEYVALATKLESYLRARLTGGFALAPPVA